MNKIHIIGSGGFFGKSIQRVAYPEYIHCWTRQSEHRSNYFNLLCEDSWDALKASKPETAILLSWPGLPNYNNNIHIDSNLPACLLLIDQLYNSGLKRLVAIGTCYEYGKANGQIDEYHPTNPENLYSLAKDTLRKVIHIKYKNTDLKIVWLRPFYVHGPYQNEHSFLPLLNQAILTNEKSFMMTSGRQIRDFIHVDDVSKHILSAAVHPSPEGIYNSCSGVPISVRELAESVIDSKKAKIRLLLGAIPDRSDEPLAFWGCPTRISNLLSTTPNLQRLLR